MNSLIQLKGQLTPRSNPSHGGGSNLAANTEVKVEKLQNIINDLEELKEYWKDKTMLINGTLINVEYNRIVPKSKRIKTILFKNSSENTADLIKGAKYDGDESNPYHVITYFIPLENLSINIEKIKICINILNEKFNNKFNNEDEKKISSIDFSKYNISKTTFMEVLTDCSMVTKLTYPKYDKTLNENQAITLYDVNKKTKDILEELGIKGREHNILDDNTVILYKDALTILVKQAPYLISMVVENLADYELPKEYEDENILELEQISKNVAELPEPTDEPYIGVLDTAFDERVYFRKWVDYEPRYMDDEVDITEEDKEHGTAVDSIIVDGPSLNPTLGDGCG